MRLDALTGPDLIFPGLTHGSRRTLLRALAERIAELYPQIDSGALFDRLLEREELGSTGIGAGVAVPHCKLDELDSVLVAIGVLAEGIDFGGVDRQPVRLFFVVLSPMDQPAAHLQCLAAISRWVAETDHVDRLLELDDAQKIYDRLHADVEAATAG